MLGTFVLSAGYFDAYFTKAQQVRQLLSQRTQAIFAEFDAINLGGYEHRTYRRVLREMEILQRRLAGKTKFDRLARYRCANLNYLVIEPGILAPEETPVGWGVLVRRQSALVLEGEPIWQDVIAADRLSLLQNIAAVATRQAEPHLG